MRIEEPISGILKSLYVYPVKSCKGISLQSAVATPFGLQHDRQWMIVKKTSGKFITQRTHPQMTQIVCALTSTHLTLSFDGLSFSVAFALDGDLIDSTVWRDTIKSKFQDVPGMNEALSKYLNTNVCLVKFAGNRVVQKESAPVGTVLQYADLYPYTIADIADFNNFNNFLEGQNLTPITIERFRTNIVLEGVPADVGTGRKSFRITTNIDTLRGEFCEPCVRCPMPDLDPETGEKTKHQIKRNLKVYRDTEKDWFSTHVTLDITGEVLLCVGDKVTL